jgi:integrase
MAEFQKNYISKPGFNRQTKEGKKRYRNNLSKLTVAELTEIPNLPPAKILKLCGQNREASRATLMALCEDLNANVSLIKQDLDLFQLFNDKYYRSCIKQKRRFFDRYFKPLYLAVGPDIFQAPNATSKEALSNLMINMSKGQWASSSIWVSALDKLNVHTGFSKVIVETMRYINPQEMWLFGRTFCICKNVKNKIEYVCPVTARQLCQKVFVQTWKNFKPKLCNQTKTFGNVSLQKAIHLITTTRYCFSPSRIVILLTGGFQHLEQLKDAHKERERQLVIWKSIATTMTYKLPIHDKIKPFFNITSVLNTNIDNIPFLEKEIVLKGLLKCDSRRSVYKILEHLVNKDTIKFLDDMLPYSITLKTNVDIYLKNATEWTRKMFQTAMEPHEHRVEKTSNNPYIRYREISTMAVNHLQFIETYTQTHFSDIMPKTIEPLRWFLAAATFEMMFNLLVEYGKSYSPNNALVKTTYNKHHATYVVTMMIRLLAVDLKDFHSCSNITTLTTKAVLEHVDNLRIPFSGERRCYKDEEMDKMLETAKDHFPYVLIITLLREVGLRVGCLANLKYFDLISKCHLPKHECSVREKRKKIHRFLTGPNLKREIMAYIRWVEINLPNVEHAKFYAFNIRNPYNRLHTGTIRKRLLKIGEGAGIKKVRVHPHVFRHTLASKLRAEGNDVMTIAGVFNHSCPSVTFKHYLIESIKDISKDLKSSYLRPKYTPEELEAEKISENDRLKKKIESALNIIHIYNKTLATYMEFDGVQQVHTQIMTDIPNLQTLLNNVADSVGDSSTF